MSPIDDSVEGVAGVEATTGYLRFEVAFWYQHLRINVHLSFYMLRFNLFCLCVCMCPYTHEYSQRPELSVRYPGTGVLGGFELPDVGGENHQSCVHHRTISLAPHNTFKSKHLKQLCTKEYCESYVSHWENTAAVIT